MSQKVGLFKKAIIQVQQKNAQCEKFFYRSNRWKLRNPQRIRLSQIYNFYPAFGFALVLSIIQDQFVKYVPEEH